MSFLFKKTNTTTRADRISSFQSTTCDFGTPLPIAYGTCKLAPNLINYQDFVAEERKTTVKTGKKSKSTTIDYAYYVYTELALCEGPIDGIGALEVGSTNYKDLASLNSKTSNEGSGLALNLGNNNNPTAYMKSKHESIAVGYNSMAYLYGRIYLGLNNASMPSYLVEVKGQLRSTGDGKDANPADVIIDLLKRVGLNGYIDTTSFNDYRNFCKGADLLISTPADAFSQQKKVQEIINDILHLTNAYMFWSVDKFKIIPRDDRQHGTWKPNKKIIYDLSENDMIKQSGGGCVAFSKKGSSELYNRWGVSFTNRSNNYETETVFYEDANSIKADGVNAASTINGNWFHTKNRAIRCAEMQARVNKIEDTRYTFKLSWVYGRLEPGDLVTLTDSAIGLEKQPVMIESIVEDAKGRLAVTAIRRADGNYSAAAIDLGGDDYNLVDFNLDPYNTSAPIFINPPPELVNASSGLEIWIALHGEHANWGGCSIYVSDQDSNYSLHGTQTNSSTFGSITTAMTKTSTEVTVKATNPKTVEFQSGSILDAENNNTLVWIDDELVVYEKATLVAANTYKLTGLKRGVYGTEIKAHVIRSTFVLCDSDLYVLELPERYNYRTLYFKFPSFNYFGAGWQPLENMQHYTAMAKSLLVPPDDVKVFDTELLANGVRRFWWEYSSDTYGLAGYEIRYMQGKYPSWEKGIQLHTGLLVSQPFETDAIRQGAHVVMIKAVNNYGLYSANAAYAVLNLGDLLEENVLYKESLGRDNWSHVTHDGVVIAGALENIDDTAFWTASGDPFWKAEEEPFWVGNYHALNVTYSTRLMASGQMWLAYDIEGNFRLEYRIVSSTNNSGQISSGSLWKPYTCKVEAYAGDVIEIRAYTEASNVPTSIKSIDLIIDVPDREEHFENLSIPVGGVELPIKTPNYYTTAVRIDAVQANKAIYRTVVTEKNPCIVRLVDINNNYMAGTVDVTWQGFSKEVI
ncbi:phage tail protein [Phascolarctobacterium sp.]|uniref:phage tail protein n=1 Tax=Phascolarctobacterium sp. TaxID=2049039 RepID=UPI002A7F9183|nr:phage tail protein [Phascolarctobacterium sp.]MDY5045515.1 phage tail protein [Phascolarctobacterium sp.]